MTDFYVGANTPFQFEYHAEEIAGKVKRLQIDTAGAHQYVYEDSPPRLLVDIPFP